MFKIINIFLFFGITLTSLNSIAVYDFTYRFKDLNIILKVHAVNSENHLQYQYQAKKIERFLHTEVFKILPQDILKKLENTANQIHFKSYHFQSDALFVPLTNHNEIQIKSTHFYDDNLFKILAHEFFHLIHYLVNPNEPVWVREGLAGFFEYHITKKYHAQNVNHALTKIHIPFLRTYSHQSKEYLLYGEHFLYFKYLIQECGGEKFFWRLVYGHPKKTGILEINHLLKEINLSWKPCKNFKTSYVYFLLAKIINKLEYSQTNTLEFTTSTYFLIPSLSEVKLDSLKNKKEIYLTPMHPYYLDFQESKEITFHHASVKIWIQKNFPYEKTMTMPDKDHHLWNILLLSF